jgi:hypothetical protein
LIDCPTLVSNIKEASSLAFLSRYFQAMTVMEKRAITTKYGAASRKNFFQKDEFGLKFI